MTATHDGTCLKELILVAILTSYITLTQALPAIDPTCQTHTHARTCAYTQMHTHIQMHTHTHTHTCADTVMAHTLRCIKKMNHYIGLHGLVSVLGVRKCFNYIAEFYTPV